MIYIIDKMLICLIYKSKFLRREKIMVKDINIFIEKGLEIWVYIFIEKKVVVFKFIKIFFKWLITR